MDEDTANALVNRDDPIPVINLSGRDAPSSDSDSKRQKIKDSLSASKLKGKLRDVASSKSEPGHSLQDQLFAKLLQQVIPTEDMADELDTANKRSARYVSRPGFSLPLMTNNFRRFNARIGVVFIFQNRLIRLFSWRTPVHTISFLAIYTFVCLDPYLLAILPIAIMLLFVMVPAFLVRHPPPSSSLLTDSYSIHGPPLAPAATVRPAAEMSKDFFRNMRDLQNSMDDFATLHDQVISLIVPSTNFSNESLSSTFFLLLFVGSCLLFITAHLLPWRAIALIIGWTIISLGHPTIQGSFLTTHEEYARPRERQAQSRLEEWIERDIVLDEVAETREVEIFELQRRSGNNEWEGWIFSSSPYDPLSSGRISGERPKGTRFFEDVQAPAGWFWYDKKWTLDLLSQDWVEERMITGVEVETEGERWVFDIMYDNGREDGRDFGSPKGKGKETKDWEEGNGLGKTGRWRRRRWVRTVKRRPVGSKKG
ncbi:MAG: hypothetical protein M1830_008419 [Pleopsidium flavum]|nr:MAG: hypothetical protein M1830_008419 [Pleopsidium flavum]